MRHILYMSAWGFVFATTTPCLTLIKRQLLAGTLPSWLSADRGAAIAYFAAVVALAGALSLLTFGIFYLKWWALTDWVLGLLISQLIQRLLTVTSLVCYCPVGLVFINLLLWLSVKQ